MTSPSSPPERPNAVADASRGRTRSLGRSLRITIALSILYGLSLPAAVLARLLPEARLMERESANTTRAFAALRAQALIVQDADELVRTLDHETVTPTDADLARLGAAVRALRAAPRADYADLAPQMRSAFARALAWTDDFAASLDESVRAFRLGESATGHARLSRANARVAGISNALDETQRHGLDDLLRHEMRMTQAGRELVAITFAWLVVGALLLTYVVRMTRARVLRPLDTLEAGLTQLSAGDLEARVPESGDELGRLATVFNRASQVLRRRAEEQGRFAAAGQLLADVAHEVNNPLMAILGTADARLDEAALDTGVREDLRLIHAQAKRAGNLLSGLLRFVRTTEEPAEIIALEPVVTRARELVEYQFRLQEINCRSTFVREGVAVLASATRIEQVLVNLLTNAVHALSASPSERLIDVRVDADDAMAHISVRDTGGGVPPAMRERLFQPFATTKGDRGTGLGLYICRRIARDCGGDLTYSDAEPGAMFTLSLPLANLVSHSTRAARTGADALVAGLRVLLVDDEPGVRTAIGRYLRRGGANVDEAANGEEALSYLLREQPDVVLLDLRMPVMDGRALLVRLEAERPAVIDRIIVLSGDLAAGSADDTPVPPARVLAKPIVLSELTARLREVADAARIRDAGVSPSSRR